ncbi:unnamed protein product [Fusarium venenatum]|uniref:F-box domain-containing protein n=1 Tax=Fusarium venenatum TaxID=56646 RepID=A0A2L2TDN1_9HYPO|nr:uncharacterized protein FVRRES_11158 [Fusarium venenatum]CEI38467.1 unnamed protein product [Fusarium venenatum]
MNDMPTPSSTTLKRQPVNNRTSPLLRLPTELYYLIFDYLDPVDSTCLGLTSKNLYPIYRRYFKYPVPLDACGDIPKTAKLWKEQYFRRGRKVECAKCVSVSQSQITRFGVEGREMLAYSQS